MCITSAFQAYLPIRKGNDPARAGRGGGQGKARQCQSEFGQAVGGGNGETHDRARRNRRDNGGSREEAAGTSGQSSREREQKLDQKYEAQVELIDEALAKVKTAEDAEN